jgi:hypothetical protein
MKKIIALISILLLTGCLGEAGKGYITKKCTKLDNINGYKLETEVEIKSKKGMVEQIKIKETYDKKLDLTSITDSKKSEKNAYKNIEMKLNKNVFEYKINIKDLTEEEKERFNIKEEQYKQLETYKDQGYTCK